MAEVDPIGSDLITPGRSDYEDDILQALADVQEICKRVAGANSNGSIEQQVLERGREALETLASFFAVPVTIVSDDLSGTLEEAVGKALRTEGPSIIIGEGDRL
jgi:hypothetical protein